MQIHGELFPVLKTGFVKKDQKNVLSKGIY